jgi:AraC-like DNA-binding protein
LYVFAVQDYIGFTPTWERRYVFHQQDEARLWRVDALGGLELLHARYVEFTFSPHAHEEFMIAVTEDGAALPRYRGGAHLLGPGDMLVLNPGEVHGGGPARGAIWRYRAFYVPAALLQRAAQELTGVEQGLPQFAEDVVGDPYVAAKLRRAHTTLEEPSSMLERESRLLEALASLVTRHVVDKLPVCRIGSEHQAVKRTREYLEAFPSDNVSLEKLAREASLSPFHLCRVFREETGLSPHAYQTLIRVRLAKTLLAKGFPISQVAVEAGFYDQAHLTRHFKRIFGVTPGRYFGKVWPPVV